MKFSKVAMCLACLGSFLLSGCISNPTSNVSQSSESSSVSQGTTSSSISMSSNDKTVVIGIELDKTTLDMVIGEKTTLKATLLPLNAQSTLVTWESSDRSIASVGYLDGTVRAWAEGSATITAKTSDGGFTATCQVNVRFVHITKLSFDEESITLQGGESYTLTPTIEPENASNKKITWSSSDKDIATVYEGTIYASSYYYGETVITATAEDGGLVASCRVTVKGKPITSIKINKSAIEIEEKETYELHASLEPYDAADKRATWSSDNGTIATVDSEGKVTGVSVGETTITVTAVNGGVSASCKVTVTEKSVWLYKLGSTEATIYTYTPTYGNPKDYIRIVTPVTNVGNRNIYCKDCTYDIEDADGNVLQSVSSVYCEPNVLKPGETGYFYKEIENSESIPDGATITAHPTIKKATESDCIRYDVTKVSFKDDATYGLKALGKVTNTSDEAVSYTEIVINVFDKNDEFVTTLSTSINKSINPAESISFEASNMLVMYRHEDFVAEDVGHYEAFAYKWQIKFDF